MADDNRKMNTPDLLRAYQWLFFSFRGRISRQAYWLAFFFIVTVLGAALQPTIDPQTGALSLRGGGLVVVAMLVAVIANLAIGVKRLHDFSAPGLLAAALFVPGLSVIATLIIGLVPGNPRPNRFGQAPDIRPG
ncbi:MAG: DUF805 domain-containing protein [Alphaproteobacteria bacterium]|nr:MAG: DUF805 domain-containing protein [Alphaproteobacteria bacterium]